MMSKTWPPPGGLAATAHRVTIALVPSDDFGEIIDHVLQCDDFGEIIDTGR
jgi:hypothetical protein